MTKKILYAATFILLVATSITLLISGCRKSSDSTTPPPMTMVMVPTLTSASVGAITQTTATFGGNVTSENNGPVTAKGVCWGTAHNPTTADSKTNDGTGTGAYVSNITGLTPATTYFVRAYATNSAGTSYGTEQTFTTLAVAGATIPSLSTVAVSAIAQTTAASGGAISSDGGGAITAKGVVWATTANPTTANSSTNDGTGTGAYVSSLTGLTANTLYHVRAYATNSAGTAYGSDVSFTTLSAGGGGSIVNVSISGLAFNPGPVTVHVGDIVRWTNNDAVGHTVTADGGAFGSALLGAGAVFTYTATAAGSFPYHCQVHPSMTGTVTVIP